MIQIVKNRPLIKSFGSIEFKHKKNNFYVYVRSKKLIAQLSCGNIIGYEQKSSKKQKIKHVSEQLAEVSANRVNVFFNRRRRPLLLKRDLQIIYKKVGLKSSILRLLTESQHNRDLYTKIMRRNLNMSELKKKLKLKWKIPRVINFMPTLTSLYIIAAAPYRFNRKMTRGLKRLLRLRRKYTKVYRKRFNFDRKKARSLFFRLVFKTGKKSNKPRYFKRVKIKKLF